MVFSLIYLNLKAHFNPVPANILQNHEGHSVTPGQFQIFLEITYTCPFEFVIQEKYAMKGLYIYIKSLPCWGYMSPFYELMQMVVLAKWTFKLPPSQILII